MWLSLKAMINSSLKTNTTFKLSLDTALSSDWQKVKPLSRIEQQFVLTHKYTILQETEKTWLIFNRAAIKHVMFLRKYKDRQLICGHNILTQGVFVTQLSGNSGTSVWRISWVTTHCRFVSDALNKWTTNANIKLHSSLSLHTKYNYIQMAQLITLIVYILLQ
jgi:hypothetical protein